MAKGIATVSTLTSAGLALELSGGLLSKAAVATWGWASGVAYPAVAAYFTTGFGATAVSAVGSTFAGIGTAIGSSFTAIGGMFGATGTVATAAATGGIAAGAAVVTSTLLPLVAPIALGIGILCAFVKMVKKAKMKTALLGRATIRGSAKEKLKAMGIIKPSRAQKKEMRQAMKQAFKKAKHLYKGDQGIAKTYVEKALQDRSAGIRSLGKNKSSSSPARSAPAAAGFNPGGTGVY